MTRKASQMSTARTDIARALRKREYERALFLLARMDRPPSQLGKLLEEVGRASLLCETYDGAPESAGPFSSYYERREAAKQALVQAAESLLLGRRVTEEENE